MGSLRQALASIGVLPKTPVSLLRSFGRRMPRSLRSAMMGMTDPRVDAWHEIGIALFAENTAVSREAQGVTTDSLRWYVCSNNSDMKHVVAFDDGGTSVETFKPSDAVMDKMWHDAGEPEQEDWDPHFGAPCFHDGRIYVPIQGPRGVWRFRVDGGAQAWRKAESLPDDGDDNLFPWCDIHPVTGVLYTCNYDRPRLVRAYERETLARRPGDDIAIGPASLDLDKVQGGVFTKRGRLILVRDDFHAVFCYSALNGHCFGAKELSEDWVEVESVTIREWHHGGIASPVHILELDNDIEDDCYLHSFAIPNPEGL